MGVCMGGGRVDVQMHGCMGECIDLIDISAVRNQQLHNRAVVVLCGEVAWCEIRLSALVYIGLGVQQDL